MYASVKRTSNSSAISVSRIKLSKEVVLSKFLNWYSNLFWITPSLERCADTFATASEIAYVASAPDLCWHLATEWGLV